jgi:glutamyl-tRNA synthetase
MLSRTIADSLFPDGLADPADWERRYPPRVLPDGAQVTRLGPSPTGPMHIGGLYTALICQDIARHSGGRYLLRIEDTDQDREMPGAREQFDQSFLHFGLVPDESESAGGDYGPYIQSARELIYLSYVRELVRQGRAYPCFATREELAAAADSQREAKLPTGYYGRWARWRHAAAADVTSALAEGRPYVIRFRADSAAGERVSYVDVLRGPLEFDANRNDVVILKSARAGRRLPTYHLAHVIDDHLMRVSLVIRGDEWLSSVPVHLQLFAALGFEPVRYAHIAPLLKVANGGKRKLSKRKDPEAAAGYYESIGYPPEAVRYYLRGLANGRLAELPLRRALAEPIVLARIGTSGALVDLAKLADISADYIATMPGEAVLAAVLDWADRFDPDLADVLRTEPGMALRALRIEREGIPNPRKDLRTWSEFRAVYGYFFTRLFRPALELSGRLAALPSAVTGAFTEAVSTAYLPSQDKDEWLGWLRALAAQHGLAVRDAAQLVRMALTGSTRSPDLHAVAMALGHDVVRQRVTALARQLEPERTR